jgi:alkanesulfonate monooxygenase SsuD/methylene tetrahydromethanopterin reductase-like flavin-dependent oxidoreductase (luciferase family)
MEEVVKCAILADKQKNDSGDADDDGDDNGAENENYHHHHQSVDSIWVPESWGREAFSTLGAIAGLTKRIKLGTSIVSIFSRTPATIAMGAVTLDMISSNRAIIGIGTSTEAIVNDWHGAKFERPASRMREYLDCINLMTSGERVSYSGEFFKVNNFKMLNKPPRKHTPIFVGAVNNNMLKLASEKADGVILYLRPLQELKKTVPILKARAKASNFEVALSIICAVSDTEPQKAKDRAAKTLAFYIAVGKYYSKFLSENGYSDEVREISSTYQKSGGDAAASQVTSKMLEELTICGTREECRMALEQFINCGISLPIMQFNPVGDSESSFRELLSTF